MNTLIQDVRYVSRAFLKAPGFTMAAVLSLAIGIGANTAVFSVIEVVQQTYRQMWERLEQAPGVSASGGVSSLPLSQMYAWGPIVVEGRTPPAGEKVLNADQRIVGGRYFQAMQIPLVGGRFFTDEDTPDKPRVAIIDDSMAQQIWPNLDPLGKRIKPAGVDAPNAPWMTVVGVVGRIKQDTLDSDSRIALYISHTQYPARSMNVVARSTVAPAALTPVVKRVVHELDPDLPLYNVRTMVQREDDSLARRRFTMLLMGAFAGLALALATIGIYGVIAYLVSQGTREIGIRLALGATRMKILSLILRQGMSLVLAGAAFGLAGAYAFARTMQSLLFGISATDTLTFTAIPLLLSAVALLASYFPLVAPRISIP